jgi:putative SOS response-associated peptidase YedK
VIAVIALSPRLFAFAGQWASWHGVARVLSALASTASMNLTTEANAIVVPIHPKAIPVILTSWL